VVYVDDIIIATNSTELLHHFKTNISKRFNMKDLGALEHFLGVRITRDRHKKRLTLDQTLYIKAIIERFNMAESKVAVTPSADGPLSKAMAPSSPGDCAFMASIPYRNAVGSLLYAAVVTRPDISNAVREVSRFMHNPGREHWSACQRILRYLKGTADFKLVYDFSGVKTDSIPSLRGYCDADHAGDIDCRKSTTGYIFFFGGAAISWSSRLQATVAISSTEAEYMAITEATNEAIFLRQLLEDMRASQQDSTVIYEDNQGAIKLASNPMHHRRTKHIDIRYHHIRHHMEIGTIKLIYVNTKEQLADSLTKGVGNSTLRVLTSAIFTES
jgi:Reverse transcriptase (RNA-dependent DNA polymerase)